MKIGYASWLGSDGLKAFVTASGLNIFRNEEADAWYVFAINGAVTHETRVFKDGGADLIDLESSFESLNGNKKSFASEIITQFEKRDKTLKLASAQTDVGSDSLATVLIKIPGTPGSADGRWIGGGIAWFDDQHKDDRIMSVEFTDEDNILGYGAGTVVGSYTDRDVDTNQQGWRIPNKRGMIEVEALGGYGFAPAGFYLKIIGKKGGELTTGTFYLNIEWGKVE